MEVKKKTTNLKETLTKMKNAIAIKLDSVRNLNLMDIEDWDLDDWFCCW